MDSRHALLCVNRFNNQRTWLGSTLSNLQRPGVFAIRFCIIMLCFCFEGICTVCRRKFLCSNLVDAPDLRVKVNPVSQSQIKETVIAYGSNLLLLYDIFYLIYDSIFPPNTIFFGTCTTYKTQTYLRCQSCSAYHWTDFRDFLTLKLPACTFVTTS